MPNKTEWTSLYYEGVEHLLWNPDWIRSHKPDGSRRTVRALMQNLRRLEAPLHHSIHLFCTLAPPSLLAKAFGIRGEAKGIGPVSSRDWPALPVTSGKPASVLELCQPDILLEGDEADVAVEIKFRSKSSLEQVLKYAALLLLRQRAARKAHKHLVFVAPYISFSDYWVRRAYSDERDLKQAVLSFHDAKIDRQLQRFRLSLDEVKASLNELSITWRSLDDLRLTVMQELKSVNTATPSPADETYLRLLKGFEAELSDWQQKG